MKDFFVYEVKTNGITFYVDSASRMSNVEHRIEKFIENASVPMKKRGMQKFKNLEKQIRTVLDNYGEVIYEKVFESNSYLRCRRREKSIIQKLIAGLNS